ncbi:MAG TPA: GNAT family protein [Streptosporangiaceae bacterium]
MADTEFTELAGPRLTLRRFRAADAPVFAAYRSVPEVARYQSWDTPFPVAAAEEAIGEMLARHPDTPGEWFQFAAVLRDGGPDGGELIGDCAACTDADDPRQAEIGFTIAPAFQRRGYATEAAGLLLGYLFGARGKHRVTATCDARNLASAAVLERLGMRREGHLRESAWAKGEWTDDLVYAMLRREWVAANREGVGDEQPDQ